MNGKPSGQQARPDLECFDFSTNVDGGPYPDDAYCGQVIREQDIRDGYARCPRCGCSWAVELLEQQAAERTAGRWQHLRPLAEDHLDSPA